MALSRCLQPIICKDKAANIIRCWQSYGYFIGKALPSYLNTYTLQIRHSYAQFLLYSAFDMLMREIFDNRRTR